MTLQRKLVDCVTYKKHVIDIKYIGPDLLCYVNEIELPNFFVNIRSAIEAGKRFVNEKLKEEKKNG